MTANSGVYAITNLITGDQYIGQSSNIARRWQRHRCQLRVGSHLNILLQAAWNVFGESAFRFEILHEAFECLDDHERHCFDERLSRIGNHGYNLAQLGGGNTFSQMTISEAEAQIAARFQVKIQDLFEDEP